MRSMRLVFALSMLLTAAPCVGAVVDPKAAAIAEKVMEAMGGRDAWEATRHVSWRFMGDRWQVWDKWTGDVRLENGKGVILMNVHTKEGRAWQNGEELTDRPLAEVLKIGHGVWVNDSYWMFMPWKLLDPGVNLAYGGEAKLPNGRTADVLALTFDEGVGLTPRNRYEVYVDRETRLPEQWSYYPRADAPEPRFTKPFTGWKRFGRILLATDRGDDKDWEIAVHEDLPRSVYESPEVSPISPKWKVPRPAEQEE